MDVFKAAMKELDKAGGGPVTMSGLATMFSLQLGAFEELLQSCKEAVIVVDRNLGRRIDVVEGHVSELRSLADRPKNISANGFYFTDSVQVVSKLKVTTSQVADMMEELFEKGAMYVRVPVVKKLAFKTAPMDNGEDVFIVKVDPKARVSAFVLAAKHLDRNKWTVRDHLTAAGRERRKQLHHTFGGLKNEGMFPTWREGAELYVRSSGKDGKLERYKASYESDSGCDSAASRSAAEIEMDDAGFTPVKRRTKKRDSEGGVPSVASKSKKDKPSQSPPGIGLAPKPGGHQDPPVPAAGNGGSKDAGGSSYAAAAGARMKGGNR